MWAAKLPGEGAALYEACEAMCSIMKDYGIAIDGGKDSLSMAARIGKEVVKAPGTLVVSSYAPCPDIRLVRIFSNLFFFYQKSRTNIENWKINEQNTKIWRKEKYGV